MHKQFIPMEFYVFDFSIPIFDYEIYSLFNCAATTNEQKKNAVLKIISIISSIKTPFFMELRKKNIRMARSFTSNVQ